MKTKFLFSLALYLSLFLQSSIAQTYTPFPDSNAVWNVANRNDTNFYTTFYKLFGDTIINSKAYSKLYINDGLIDTVIDMNSPNTLYYGALRQDTTEKKIFFFPANPYHYSAEFVLYDFSLNIGDSIFIPWSNTFFISAKCISITNTMLGGMQRRALIIKLGNLQYTKWVEGIGDSYKGLFAAMNVPYYSTVLLCFSNNDSTIYFYNSPDNFYYSPPFADSSIFHNCSYHGIINLIINADELKNNTLSEIFISPNPLYTTSFVYIPDNISINGLTIEIFDIQGKKVKDYFNLNNHQILVQREDFIAAGVYFARIKSDKYLETIKLIVQ